MDDDDVLLPPNLKNTLFVTLISFLCWHVVKRTQPILLQLCGFERNFNCRRVAVSSQSFICIGHLYEVCMAEFRSLLSTLGPHLNDLILDE